MLKPLHRFQRLFRLRTISVIRIGFGIANHAALIHNKSAGHGHRPAGIVIKRGQVDTAAGIDLLKILRKNEGQTELLGISVLGIEQNIEAIAFFFVELFVVLRKLRANGNQIAAKALYVT